MSARLMHLRYLLPLAALLLLAVAACGDDDDSGQPAETDNLLTNPGFEDGASGWTGREGPATISDAQASTGSNSLLVSLDVDETSSASGGEFAFQEITLEEVPEFMSFEYFVDDWVRGTDNQYIEAVVIVTGSGAGMPVCPGGEPCPNIQMRYVLGGVTVEPSQVLNARWRFTGEQEPATGEWLHFESNLRNDMTEDWGSLPAVVESVKVQLEARFDDKGADELDTVIAVHWDDIYLGPE